MNKTSRTAMWMLVVLVVGGMALGNSHIQNRDDPTSGQQQPRPGPQDPPIDTNPADDSPMQQAQQGQRIQTQEEITAAQQLVVHGASITPLPCTDPTCDNDGDTKIAEIDCDDTNPQMFPGNSEIGDGVDNDCNGFIDGDDSNTELPEGWYQISKNMIPTVAEARSDGDNRYESYNPGGVTLEDGKFKTTQSGKRAIISKKVKIDKNTEYIASATAEGCSIKLQLFFDDQAASREPGNWFLNLFTTPNLIQSNEGRERVTVRSRSSATAEYAGILIEVSSNNCLISQPQLERAGEEAAEYNDAKIPHELVPNLEVQSINASSCCPEKSCWNGFACIANMDYSSKVLERVTDTAMYRCVNGNWATATPRKDWYNKETGYCQDEKQCFVSNNGDATKSVSDFYSSSPPLCINDGEFIFDHYCDKGEWTSRTKFVAEKLLSYAGDEFTLYCSNYTNSLNELDSAAQLLAGFEQQGCYRLQLSDATILDSHENTCINNVCVLRSGDTVAFATTFNKRLDGHESLLRAFGVAEDKLATSCSISDGFTACDNIEDGELLYSSTYNATIFSKGGLTPSILERIVEWFVGLFTEASQPTTLEKNFRELYLLQQGDIKAKALTQRLGDTQKLVAEYENYQTPVCDYVSHAEAAPASASFLEGNSLFNSVSCTQQQNVQKVEISGKNEQGRAFVNFFWPQLTARMRANH